MKKLAIIDTFALLHRAYHAIPNLTTKDGKMVNAAFGFTSILLKLIQDIKPDYVVAAFDLPHETFRKKEYKEYKAQREAPDKDFIDQISIVEEILEAFSIPKLAVPGYEADDVIGSLSKHFSATGDMDVIIISGDLDTLQLVNKRTRVFTMRKGINDTMYYDTAAVKDRYGLKPEQIIDMKAIAGDSSDNIPGVKGIGEKGALTLLHEFGSLEKIYKNIDSDKIKPRTRELLKEHEKEAFQSKMLATIVTDLQIKLNLEKAHINHYRNDRVMKLFQELEFRSLLNKLPSNGESAARPTPAAQHGNYEIVDSEAGIKRVAKLLAAQKLFCFDTETTGLDPLQCEILGASFSWKEKHGVYIHLRDTASRGAFSKHLGPIFLDATIQKVGHNMKFDLAILRSLSMRVENLHFDTLLAAYLVHSERSLKLEELVFSYLGIKMQNLKELAEESLGEKIGQKKDIPVRKIDPSALAYYGAEDADMTLRLFHKLDPVITAEKMRTLLQNIEMPLIPVLAEMERTGVLIDVPYLKTMAQELTRDVSRLEQKIHQAAGAEFNIASPLQLKEVLFEKLKIDTHGIKRKKTGLSTAAAELDKLLDRHPIVPMILEYRELTKLLNTYIEPLPKLINPDDKRLHTNFNQTIAATGRLSSTNPNLQNIPARTELGRRIRRAFVAQAGFELISADYSQIELRLAAIISKDPKMLKSFKAGEDIHTRTAAEIHGLPLKDVTPDIRRTAKEVNFGVIYGLGSTGLAQRTGMSRAEAKEFIEKYFMLYKGVKKYIEDTKSFAHRHGYVETLFGRKRKLPEIKSSSPMLIAQAERMAINMPLQGTAADLMKLAMINVVEALHNEMPDTKMILQVHDELVFEVKKSEIHNAARVIQKTMEGVAPYSIPLAVDVKIGHNWEDMKLIST